MTEEPNFAEQLHSTRDRAGSLARDLDHICSALYTVGNTKLADRLSILAQEAELISEAVSRAATSAVDAYWGASNAGTSNMMRAVLAVIDVKQKSLATEQPSA